MKITIDLSQLSNNEVLELSLLIGNSIDFSIENDEMQANYEASQELDLYICENNIE